VSRARLDDPVARSARRILLIGVTGSGKSPLAREVESRTGIPAIDVDALAWQPGWVKTPESEFVAAVYEIAATDSWILDSAWTAIRPVVLPRAELIVALDLPRWVSLSRLLVRTGRRIVTRERICGDNVETLRSVLSGDSILTWHFRSFADKRRQMAQWEADPATPPVLRLRTEAEVRRWVDDLAGSTP
jgi:adenylate kinase family enzyme